MSRSNSTFSIALVTILFAGVCFGVFTVYNEPTSKKGEVKGINETKSSVSSSSSLSSSLSDKNIPVLD
ncbi:MAG: hypothetical protein WCK98_03995 [bacterium]